MSKFIEVTMHTAGRTYGKKMLVDVSWKAISSYDCFTRIFSNFDFDEGGDFIDVRETYAEIKELIMGTEEKKASRTQVALEEILEFVERTPFSNHDTEAIRNIVVQVLSR